MKKKENILTSAIAGNILEYYDFTVYAVFSVAIGKTFFSSANSATQVLLSLLTFAIGFMTRPIGGIFFGYIGDKFGRKVSLISSMLGMTIPTFIIGMIPSYESIGITAPILLVIMRLTQGLCISGEGTGAAIFILEHKKNLKAGLTGGIVHASGIGGTLLATIVGIILEKILPGSNASWRIAFILGGVLGLVGLYLRFNVSETPIFQMLAKKKQQSKSSFFSVVHEAWQSMLITASLGAFASSIVYLVKTYIRVYYTQVMHCSDITSLYILFYSSIIMMISMIISGYLSDLLGKFKMIKISTISILSLILPALYIMSNGTNIIYQLMGVTLLAFLGGLISGSAYIFVISLFKAKQKFFGVSFSYNLGIALFGGTSASVASILVNKTGLHYSPAFYIMFNAFCFFLLINYFKDKIDALLKQHDKEHNTVEE